MNLFEIGHSLARQFGPENWTLYKGKHLLSFLDNHDVERIINKLNNPSHFNAVHTLMYTLPGIPSIYYGSEFGIEGRKENGSDAPLRPCLHLDDYADAQETNPYTAWITKLGNIRRTSPALAYGEYKELLLTNRQYAFMRSYEGEDVIVSTTHRQQFPSLIAEDRLPLPVPCKINRMTYAMAESKLLWLRAKVKSFLPTDKVLFASECYLSYNIDIILAKGANI